MTYRVCYLVEIQFITDEKPPKRSTLPTQKANTSHLKGQHFPPKRSTLSTQKANTSHPKGQHFPPKRSTLSTQKVNTLIGNPAVNLGFSDGIRPKCQVFPMRSLYEPDRWMNHSKGQHPQNGLKALFPFHPKGQHIQNGCKSEAVQLPKGQCPTKNLKNLCLYHLKGKHLFKRNGMGYDLSTQKVNT